MANKLFISLPSLAALELSSTKDILNLAKQLIDALKMIDHEDYEGYYDYDELQHLYRLTMKTDRHLGLLLLEAIKPWQDHRSKNNVSSKRDYRVNGASVSGSLLASYIDNAAGSLFLSLAPASDIAVTEGHDILCRVTPVVIEKHALYHWFIANRNPQRQLDKDYRKHSKFKEHTGKKGDIISPWTYSDDAAVKLLRHAVYSKTAKRLILHHKKDKKILVFFNENLSQPTYHAYQIPEKDAYELSKFTNESIKKMKKVPYTD